MKLEDKLALIKRKIDRESHIEVNQDKFKADKVQAVLFICPAKVYEKNDETGECIVNFDNCLECGCCMVAARDYVVWDNPNGGFGISNKFG